MSDGANDANDANGANGANRGSASSPAAPTSGGAPQDLARLVRELLAQRDRPRMETHKFWRTQPVVPYDEAAAAEQGPLRVQTVAEVPQQPQKLPDGFEWCTVDVTLDAHLAELYTLLYENYIEDDDEQFRFKYPAPFLRWALTPPGWNAQFYVGIRASQSHKLVAFISGVPATLAVRAQSLQTVEINFLCVHKQLRAKRLAPVMIKEVTRRVNLTGVWQALFTAGTVVPTPFTTTQYYHRVLSWSKLYEVGFAHLPADSTPAQQVAQCALPAKPSLRGWRAMRADDAERVGALLAVYLAKFAVHPRFAMDELVHWLVPRDAASPVRSFVVETDGEISDFASFYGLESSVLGNAQHSSIRVAYAFYYATTAADLRARLVPLFSALLVEAKSCGYDVLNALTVMDNPLVFKPLNFKPGDGFLNYNLFNWRTPPVNGGVEAARALAAEGADADAVARELAKEPRVGVVLL